MNVDEKILLEQLTNSIKEIGPLFTEKKFSTKDTGLTYRTIQGWSEKGLLNNFQEKEGKWHKFSLLELVEILIYKELRDVGFGIKDLKQVKSHICSGMEDLGVDSYLNALAEHFLKKENSYKSIKFTVLFWSVFETLLGKNIHLLVSFGKNGEVFCGMPLDTTIAAILSNENDEDMEKYRDSLVIISFRRIFRRLKVQFAKEEGFRKLLEQILSFEADKVEFNTNVDGSISNIRTTEYLNYNPEEKSLVDLIKAEKNQSLTVNVNNDGKITTIKRNRKIK